MASAFHLNDEGSALILVVRENGQPKDISDATVKQIEIVKPDGTTVVETAAFTTTGTDGKIQYVFLTAELNQVGKWLARGYLETPGWTGHTSQVSFAVDP